ncbi:MAG: PAS domain S-box protein, partial [Thermoanaerobaculia bacterium]|nr:PAS domain S-box protein [Thermoanaerobaculia bacterium]
MSVGAEGDPADATGPEPRILGELLALPIFLLRLPTSKRVAEFLARALAYLPGVTAARVCLGDARATAGPFVERACEGCTVAGFGETPMAGSRGCRVAGREGYYVVRQATPSGLYGFMICQVDGADRLAPYLPFLNNLGGFLALALENRRQRAELETANRRLHHDVEKRRQIEARLRDHRARLEEEVERRTAELRRLNDDLHLEIAERTRAEERLRLAAAIVDSSNDAIIGKDLEQRVLSWNRAAEEIYGYSAAEMIGRSIARLVPADREDELGVNLSQIREGKPVAHFETVRRR